MSGLVAGRLFSLLPKYMPLAEKYSLVDTLWTKYSPRSRVRLRIGSDVEEAEVLSTFESHLDETIHSYKIPGQLEHRFAWLSDGDVGVQQQILNHFLKQDKALAYNGIRERLPIFLRQIGEHQAITQRVNQIVTIGGHTIELVFDAKATGVSFENPTPVLANPPASQVSAEPSGCLVFIVVAVVLVLLPILLERF